MPKSETDWYGKYIEARLTIQQQAERIRALEAEDTYNASMISAAATKIDGLERQLSEVVGYAGKLREALDTAQPFVEQSVEQLHEALKGHKPHVHMQADKDKQQVVDALALPLPKAMQG